MPVTLDNYKDVFTYHAPNAEQQEFYKLIRDSAAQFCYTILSCTPVCADQQAAIRLIREATMTANAAVALNGVV